MSAASSAARLFRHAASARYRCALANKVACASSKLWTEALQVVMWQCALRLAHSERARNEAAVRFEKFHDRPLAVPSVAPQPHAAPVEDVALAIGLLEFSP
jgi:hypothetical protein